MEKNLERPGVPFPESFKESELFEALLNADINYIVLFLKAPNFGPWLFYAIRTIFTMEPTIQLHGLFLNAVLLSEPEHPLSQLFYKTLAKIDPAKAGLIILDLLKVCLKGNLPQEQFPHLLSHAETLMQELEKVASIWKLNADDEPHLRIFFRVKVIDRKFLKQLNIWPSEDGKQYLRNEEVGTIVEITGASSEDTLQIAVTKRGAERLSFYFPRDLIPYIEELLAEEGLRVPFSEQLQQELDKMREPQVPLKTSFNFRSLTLLFGLTFSRAENNLGDLEEFIDTKSRESKERGDIGREYAEGIVVSHHGIQIFLVYDANLKSEWNVRRSPYKIEGFVHENNLYSVDPQYHQEIKTYLATCPASELKHTLPWKEATLVGGEDVFIDLTSLDRDEIYMGHDLAFQNELEVLVRDTENPISVVDVGMGGGELFQRLTRQFASNRQVQFYGTEPNPKLRRLAKMRNPKLRISDLPAEKLSEAPFVQALSGTHKIAILEGVLAQGVNRSSKGKEVLAELFRMGFDKIFVAGNTPVNLDFEELAPLFERHGYLLERTLYPQNLFNYNSPKVMVIISKVEKVEGPSLKSSL